MCKFPGKCGNSQENVEIFGRIQEKTSVNLENSGKMWKFPWKCGNFRKNSRKNQCFLRKFRKNVEIPMKMWKFSKKKSIGDGAYQFESSSETVQVSG
jgi:hypothetical protein